MSQRPPPPNPLRSVARPKQARSADSLRRLLDAAESLLEEKRFGELAIADITKRARSSVGGFYARFRDKDELLLALHERFAAQFDARLDAITEGWGEADRLRPVLQLLLEMHRTHRGTLTAFASRAAENRRLWKAGAGFRGHVITRVTDLLLSSLRSRAREHASTREELTHPDPELAAGLAAQLVLGLVEQGSSSGAALPDLRLQEELELMLLRYLGAPDCT